MKTYGHTHTHTYTHTYTHIYTHTYTHTHTHTYTHTHTIETYGLAPHNRNIWPTANQYKHMAQRHAHSQPIETYGRAAHNRNIWSTATERHTIDYVTPDRFFCLLFKRPLYHYLRAWQIRTS